MNTGHARILAALAGYLVDSAKGGDSFDLRACANLKAEIHKTYQFSPEIQMSYSDESAVTSRMRNKVTKQCHNILDFLKFDVAQSRKEEILTEFSKQYCVPIGRDANLEQAYISTRM